MPRADLDSILQRIDVLQTEIKAHVPVTNATVQFRADLAGLLVVAMAASYESCVKEVLTSYASRHHQEFGSFAINHFKKLNSRINLSDLHGYARTFGGGIGHQFGQLLITRKAALNGRIGKDIGAAYTQLLSWRHDFAHEGLRNTTLEEAMFTHRLAKRVLYVFEEAFR